MPAPKTKLKILFFFLLVLGFSFLFFSWSKARAQSTITLSAIPPRLELKVAPGGTVQETIKVRNDSDTELVVQSEVKDFIVVDDKGTPMVVEEEVSGRWSLASWVSISPTKNVLKPGDIQLISLVVAVPKDALAGGHYAMVLHSPLTEALISAGSGTAVAQKVGTLIYFQVEGPITEEANLIRFEADKTWAEYGPINLTAEIQNLSDIHIKPKGQITVYNMLNKASASLSLEEINIFPFKSRTYKSVFPGKWHFGRYKAELKANYGPSNKILTGLIYFWIIPWTIVALVALVLALVLLLGLLLYQKKKRKKKKPEKKEPEKPVSPPPVEKAEIKSSSS